MWLTLVCALFFFPGVFYGTVNVIRGDYVTGFVVFGVVLPIFFALLAVNLVAGGRTALRARHESTGTTLRSDRTFGALLVVALVVIVPAGAVFLWYSVRGQLDMFPSGHVRVVAMVVMAGATVTAIMGLASVLRRKGIGYVRLGSEGLEIANIVSTDFIGWEDIVAVEDHSEDNKRTRKAIVLGLKDGTEKVIDGADFYVPGGTGLYWMVRHYWAHPGDRAELSDSRALQRLDLGRFDLA